MRQENREFYNIAQNNDWVDISKFWSWPTQEILEDIKNIPDKYWSKPFDGGNKDNQEGYDDYESNRSLPGTEEGAKLIEARGWKTAMFLNETGFSKDQILKFKPVYKDSWEYKDRWNYIENERKWTDIAKFSPTLQKFFESAIFPYLHVGYIFVTALEPGGIVTKHDDIPDGSIPLLGGEKLHAFDMCNVFNLCLNHVESCEAVFNDKVMPSYEGCLMWTNTGKKHWVVNMNRETQYKIIFQALFKKEFRKKVITQL
jgi:hypothetical protein